jgi:hypothetical protein
VSRTEKSCMPCAWRSHWDRASYLSAEAACTRCAGGQRANAQTIQWTEFIEEPPYIPSDPAKHLDMCKQIRAKRDAEVGLRTDTPPIMEYCR